MTPAGKIEPQPWMTAPEALAVVTALTADGAELRFVGGCVRDTLADRPITDVDLATPEPPERVVALLERAGLKAVPTGIKHGTITAVSGGVPFEVTTLREDVETYGRHAKVAFTDDWVADAARRDFTINAMGYAYLDQELLDPYEGRRDLEARVRGVGHHPPDRWRRARSLRATTPGAQSDGDESPSSTSLVRPEFRKVPIWHSRRVASGSG
jgi:poly(A) polymerase